MFKIATAIIILVFMTACNLFVNGELYTFTEMQCVDYGWERSSDNDQWAKNIEIFLESEGISVNKIEAFDDGGTYCQACYICPTGRSIEVWIDEEDSERIEALGFFKPE